MINVFTNILEAILRALGFGVNLKDIPEDAKFKSDTEADISRVKMVRSKNKTF